MKRTGIGFLVLLVAVLTLVFRAGAAPKVVVDGVCLQLDVPPRVERGLVIVPLRDVFEALGAGVTWDAPGTIEIRREEVLLQLTVGSSGASRNGVSFRLPAPPRLVDGTVMAPVVLVEALGAEYSWNRIARTVSISSGARPVSAEDNSAGPPAVPEMIDRKYVWDYGGKRWTYELQVPREIYDYYAGLERPPTSDYSVYVTDPVDDPFIAAIAAKFQEVAEQEGYTPKRTVEFVVTFVQSLKYVTDDISKGFDQYARYPLETLVEQEGDCEDTSILLAAILRKMDFGVVLVLLPGNPGHMAVGVWGENLPGVYYEYQGVRYYYVETTATGWPIGQIPNEFRNRQAIILPLVPQLVITHEWTSRGTVGGYIELQVTVRNDGTAVARNTRVYAALDAGNGRVYDQRWSEPLDLEPRSRGRYTLRLKTPASVETRLVVRIVSDGFQVDESASGWFRT